MATYLTPHEAIVSVLRASKLTTVGVPNGPGRDYNWSNPDGSAGSPYYKDAKEPQPAFPFVIYDVQNSKGPGHTFDDSYPEEFDVEIKVVGLNPWIHVIGTPYGNPRFSVFSFLDAMQAQPFVFNGVNFICCKWLRTDWEIMEDPERAPQSEAPAGGVYNNVYVARATYQMELGAVYPIYQY